MQNPIPRILTFALLGMLAAGCANICPPKTLREGDVSELRKKRKEEFTREFDQQRDFAEFEAARALLEQQNDREGCREGLGKLLARNPGHREARLLMAELSLADDDAAAAYDHAKTALNLYPNDAPTQYMMALVYDAQGKNADALGYFERAAKMDPQNQAYAAAYETARKIAHQQRNLTSTTLQAKRADFTDEPLGEASAAAYTESVERTHRSDSADRTDFKGISENNLAIECLKNGQNALIEGSSQAAFDWFCQAASADPDNPQIPLAAAGMMLRFNRHDLAVDLLLPATKRFPNSASIFRMLGASQYRKGDYKSSQVSLQQALSLDKSNALTYFLMGCALAKLGQNDAAENHFRQARALDPKYRIVR